MLTALRALRPILKVYREGPRGLLLGGAILSATTAICGIALLGLSGWFITATAIAGLSATAALAFDVFAPAAAIRLLAIGRTAARYGERLVTHDAALGILADLRARLFRGWAMPDAARRMMLRPARTLFRLTLDLDALDSLYLRLFVPAVAALGTTLLASVALGLMQPWLGLAAAGTLIVGGFAVPLMAARRAMASARRRAHALEVLRSRTVDLVSGQTELAMAGRLVAQRQGIIAADHRLAAADDILHRIETRAGAAFNLLGAALLAGTLIAVAALAHRNTIDVPVAVLGLLIVLTAFEPFAALRRGAIEFGRTLLAAKRIGPRLADEAPAMRVAAPAQDEALRLDGVTASYPGAAEPALRDVALTLRPGERVAVVGPSGAGKSSLLALVAGELMAQSGRLAALPATLFTQRTQLFQDSVRGNLALADPAAGDARLHAALKAAGLEADVASLPAGLDTRLGEAGAGLSGGQARRLALARLMLRDTPLWLLDEPTESLDSSTARDIIGRIFDRSQGRTLLIATHIRREAENADRLVMMERGRIIATAKRGESGFETALAALRPD